MATLRRDAVATRSVLLELQDEMRFTREGHTFLDQKRMLLAGEMLRWLQRYETLRRQYLDEHGAARRALAGAVARHGLQELRQLPSAEISLSSVDVSSANFLGVMIRSWSGEPRTKPPEQQPLNPSPEARNAVQGFTRLLQCAVELAIVSGNLARLLAEYRRTERRARSLENVVLPELAETIQHIDEQLEEQDQEEAARIRLSRG